MVRLSGVRLELVLLLLHLASIWMTLAAGWLLASRCFYTRRERAGAVTLLAIWLALPIAGTSLLLIDPYVTARSISTPCVLFSLVAAVNFAASVRGPEPWRWSSLVVAAALLGVAAAVHPLMAAYGFACVLALSTTIPERRSTRIGAIIVLCLAAVMVAAVLQTVAQPEGEAYHQVAMSRYYWFLSQWHWYEVAGLAAPIAILCGFAARARRDAAGTQLAVLQMVLVVGLGSIVVALLFARAEMATHIVARLQPLRVFQQVYIVMILFLGAIVADWLRRRMLAWVGIVGLLGAVMFFAERQTFPSSPHVELPSRTANAWTQAFEWIRANTPVDAVFALDADYITLPGEDAQCFRAISERSALPDYSKDGGEAAIAPRLTAAWTAGQRAQARLSQESDAERLQALASEGVDWVVLERSAATSFACDYANAAVKVCRLPNGNSADGVRLSSLPASRSQEQARQ